MKRSIKIASIAIAGIVSLGFLLSAPVILEPPEAVSL
jgi:hypothetical protein